MIRETLQRIEEVGWSSVGWGGPNGEECVLHAFNQVMGILDGIDVSYGELAHDGYRHISNAGHAVFGGGYKSVGEYNDKCAKSMDDVRLWLDKAAAEAGELPL